MILGTIFRLIEILSEKCTNLLSNYLNKGKVGLYLGSGVSAALGLPNWTKLVRGCITDLPAAAVTIDDSKEFDPKYYSGKFKKACDSSEAYLECVRANLYKGVGFDFAGIRKEMLIALTSLMVGKVRGNVRDIITLNYDDVIELYLQINGLRVSQVDKKPLDSFPSDVSILHLHGFLPYHTDVWERSDSIILTEEEFEKRERGSDYVKNVIDEFYKSHIFLGVGLHPNTVTKDIAPYAQVLLSDWYEKEKIDRGYPFGFVFLTDYSEEQAQKMLDSGIVPCLISDTDKIPPAIFSIAQKASKVKS